MNEIPAQPTLLKDPQKDTLFCVYDLCSQPVSMGDVFSFQLGMYALASLLNIKKIDFCFKFDPAVRHADSTFFHMLEPDQHLHRIFKLTHILELNPLLNAVYIANSEESFARIVSNYGEQAVSWPTPELLHARTYLYYGLFDIFTVYWQTFGQMPVVPLRTPQKNWVAKFFEKHLGENLPVTVNIRNNPNIDPSRNTNIGVWTEFFKYCENRHPLKFIIVCDYHEIVPEWRSLSNVVFTKDAHSTVDMDYAMTLSSAFHLGTASGLAIPHFTNQPYLVANITLKDHVALYNGNLAEDEQGILRFVFNGPLQKMTPERETVAMLIGETENILTNVDWSQWKMSVQ